MQYAPWTPQDDPGGGDRRRPAWGKTWGGLMLVCRAYNVMDAVVVEVSCVHSDDPIGSHLVVREERRGNGVEPDAHLQAISDVCDLARYAGLLREPCDFS